MIDGFNIGDRVKWRGRDGKISCCSDVIKKFYEVATGNGESCYYASTMNNGWILVRDLIKI
jgi:hypothetical protein